MLWLVMIDSFKFCTLLSPQIVWTHIFPVLATSLLTLQITSLNHGVWQLSTGSGRSRTYELSRGRTSSMVSTSLSFVFKWLLCHLYLISLHKLSPWTVRRADADWAPPPQGSAHHGRGFQAGDDGRGAAGQRSRGEGVPLPGPAAALPSRLLRCHEGATTKLSTAPRAQELPNPDHWRHFAAAGSLGLFLGQALDAGETWILLLKCDVA